MERYLQTVSWSLPACLPTPSQNVVVPTCLPTPYPNCFIVPTCLPTPTRTPSQTVSQSLPSLHAFNPQPNCFIVPTRLQSPPKPIPKLFHSPYLPANPQTKCFIVPTYLPACLPANPHPTSFIVPTCLHAKPKVCWLVYSELLLVT